MLEPYVYAYVYRRPASDAGWSSIIAVCVSGLVPKRTADLQVKPRIDGERAQGSGYPLPL